MADCFCLTKLCVIFLFNYTAITESYFCVKRAKNVKLLNDLKLDKDEYKKKIMIL